MPRHWNKLACSTKPGGKAEPGTTAWPPADPRVPMQFWRLNEFTVLNARRFAQWSESPDNVTEHIFFIVVEGLIIFKTLG